MVIIHKRLEALVRLAPLDRSNSAAAFDVRARDEILDAGCDYMLVGGPGMLPGLDGFEGDGAAGEFLDLGVIEFAEMILDLSAVGLGGRKVRDGFHFEPLAFVRNWPFGDEGFVHVHIADVDSNGCFVVGTELGPDVSGDNGSHIAIQPGWNEGDVVDDVASDRRIDVRVGEVTTDCETCGIGRGVLFVRDLLARAGESGIGGGGHCGRGTEGNLKSSRL